jgi:heme A synthase
MEGVMTYGETVGGFIGVCLIVLVASFLGLRKPPTVLWLVLAGIAIAACVFLGITTWGTQMTVTVGGFLAIAIFTFFVVPRIIESRREKERSQPPRSQ